MWAKVSIHSFVLSVASLVLGVSSAFAATEGCGDPEPVLESVMSEPPEWRLPVSADRPNQLTQARVSLTLLPPANQGDPWKMRIKTSFPDPKPFGIPYSFEKLELRWSSSTGTHTSLIDWTQSCSSAGRSLFPGQAWSEDREILGSEGQAVLDAASISLWGSRN